MHNLSYINLLDLQSHLKIERAEGLPSRVFDPIRKKYLIATPEEIVRQLWIVYLTEKLNVNPKLIAVERTFELNTLKKRFDLIVFSRDTTPFLLAEFKSPGTLLNQAAFDQIADYNMQWQVPYALISNGVEHYCFQIDDMEKKLIWIDTLPFN